MQRSFLFTSLLLVSLCQTLNAQPDTLWTKTIGYDVGEYLTSIEQTSDGGFILAGFTESFSVDSSAEYWLVRLNSSADTVWTKVYTAGEKYEDQRALQTADGGFAIAGDGDPWLIKTDADGTIEWQQARSTLGTGDISVYGFVETVDSGFVACGLVEHEDRRSALVVKTDKLGAITWIDSIGSEHTMGALAVIETSDSGLVLAGVKERPTGGGVYHGWLQKLSADGDSLASVFYGNTAAGNEERFNTVRATSDGGLILLGEQILDGQSKDIILVKTDGDGVSAWEQTFGGTGEDEGFDVIQTSDSGFILVGYGDLTSSGGLDMLVIHTDASGTTEWTKQMGGSSLAAATSVTELSPGEYLAVGAMVPESDSLMDGWIIRLSTPSVAVDDHFGAPVRFALHANYPNPFNPVTTIGFDLPQTAAVTLTVYDILGREVRWLMNRSMGPGYHHVTWNGRTNDGRDVPTGIYITRLETPGYTTSIKMLLLK